MTRPVSNVPVAVAGIGFREAAGADALLDALARAGGADLRRLAVPAPKVRHPAVLALAQLGYEIVPIAAAVLMRQDTLTDSAASRAAHGTGSVAEACALAALEGGQLTGPRVISADGMATAAIVLAGDPS